jgi:hypothetical protein
MKKATIILQNGKFLGGKDCIQNFGGETQWECPLVSQENKMGGVSIVMAL